MIKFFRKIRYDLMKKNLPASEGTAKQTNKIGKPASHSWRYLKYALGEILLVMIGILLALQVSNWNDRRKELVTIERLIHKVEDDIATTIRQANYDLQSSIVRDSLIKKVLNYDVSRLDYQDNPDLQYLSTFRFTLDPALDNLNKLRVMDKVLPTKYIFINRFLDGFDFVIGREENAMMALKESSKKNAEYMNMNYAWPRMSDSLSKEEAYNYYLQDESYKNRLFTHWENAMEYNSWIARYRASFLFLSTRIKFAMADISWKNYEAAEIKSVLEEFNQTPFKLIKPGSGLDSIPPINTSSWPLIFNWSKDKLQIKIYNKSGVLVDDIHMNSHSFTIDAPNSRHNGNLGPNSRFNLDTEYAGIYEVYKNDTLVNKYHSVQNGFLILE